MSLYYLTEYNTPCIIYNLLIGENGVIYEGCGLDRALQYAGTENAGGPSLSIAFIGTFTKRVPNALAQKAFDSLRSVSCFTVSNLASVYKTSLLH